MKRLLAVLALVAWTFAASADVVIEERKSPSALLWLAPAGLAIAIVVAVRSRRRAEP